MQQGAMNARMDIDRGQLAPARPMSERYRNVGNR